MKVKIKLIALLFLCAVMTGCETKEYKLTLDYGNGRVETTSYEKFDYVTIPRLKDTDELCFGGWASTKNGEPEFGSSSFSITSDKTYYALWVKKCSVYFVDRYEQSLDIHYTGPQGEVFNFSDVIPNAYLEPYFVFKGWSVDGKEENIISEITFKEEDVFLYAVWEQKIFRIYLDLNGGTGANISNIEVKKGDYLQYSSLPTNGFSYGVYTFEGWSETKNGKVITSDFKPEKDMTLYAVWSHNGQVKDKTDDN